MIVKDYAGTTRMRTRKAILARLGTFREGSDAAFELCHDASGGTLCVLMHDDLAYLHYFPEPDHLCHAGFRAQGATPPKCPKWPTFRTVADGPLKVARESVVDIDTAMKAVKDFYRSDGLPESVEWEEL